MKTQPRLPCSILRTALLLLLGFRLASAQADHVALFDALRAGAEVWTWEGARLDRQEQGFTLRRSKGDPGAVYLSDHFTWSTNAEVVLEVARVGAGSCSLQILAFHGTQYLDALDGATDVSAGGAYRTSFQGLAFPPGTDHVSFKLWIADRPDASVDVRNLVYSVDYDPQQVLLDRRVDARTSVVTDQTTWTPGPGGGVAALAPGASYGAVLLEDHAPVRTNGLVVVELEAVHNGSVTAQACVFDAAGKYLSSIDLVQKATSSISCSLADVVWPEGAATFQIKLWLGGGDGAAATVQRLLVLP